VPVPTSGTFLELVEWFLVIGGDLEYQILKKNEKLQTLTS